MLNLQVIATVEVTGVAPEDEEEDYEPLRDVAVHGDQVIVLTTDQHARGSGLRLLDLDGRFVRTIAAGQFRNPFAVTASHGRAFVVDDVEDNDDDDEEPGKVLYIIDIQSGDILQSVNVELQGTVSAILADDDEIYIASYSRVVVLRYAGAEA